MDFAFFGSAVLWMLVTYPAYWLFQWSIEGEPLQLWQRSRAEPSKLVMSPSVTAVPDK